MDDLGQTIRVQLGSSAVLMLGLGYLAAYLSFPESFKVNNIYGNYYDMQ